MDQTRFERLLEAYGADPRRWPRDERAAAEAFLAGEGAALRAALFDARMTDHALDASPEVAPSAALRAAVLASAPRARSARSGGFFGAWTPPRWAAAAGLAASCLLGVAAGAHAASHIAADLQAQALLADAVPSFEDLEVAG